MQSSIDWLAIRMQNQASVLAGFGSPDAVCTKPENKNQMQDVIGATISSHNSTDHTDSAFSTSFPCSSLDTLVHELRQPLSAIEHLAFYLQLISSDPTVCSHSERIQDLIARANQILEQAMTANAGCCSGV
jgi:hypothetical protein